MLKENFYNILIDDQEITIKLNRKLIDQETLNNLLDYLKLESIRNKSELTEELIKELADEIDVAAWKKLKPKFIKE